MRNFLNQAKSVIVGHAIADALGVPVEFMSREELKKNPVTDMMGYGTHKVPKGSWSDDTSMALCTLDVLTSGSIDYGKIMDNFCKWCYENEYTPTGVNFDIGIGCSQAIGNYKYGKPYNECGLSDEYSNGNGSLMRIHPVTLYLSNSDISTKEKIEIIHNVSALTHAHKRSMIGCGIYSFILWELLENPQIESIYKGIEKAKEYYCGEGELKYYEKILNGKLESLTENEILSSGYVVHSLEASLWCLLTTNSYEVCVLKAVNLGSDTDTVGAIAGGLAGALYGYDSIPSNWKDSLIKLQWIEELCESAYRD